METRCGREFQKTGTKKISSSFCADMTNTCTEKEQETFLTRLKKCRYFPGAGRRKSAGYACRTPCTARLSEAFDFI